jgi:hypothetical protein
MTQRSVMAVFLLAFCGSALAEAPAPRGAYFGVAGGASLFNDDGSLGLYDDTDTSFHGYLGYKFFPHFAVEARYADIGSFSDGFDRLELTAIAVYAQGIIPFSTSGWELFGHIGFADISQKVPGMYSASDTAGMAGGGVRWHINPTFAVGAQIDAYAWQNSDIGSRYDLSAGTQQLVFQISF